MNEEMLREIVKSVVSKINLEQADAEKICSTVADKITNNNSEVNDMDSDNIEDFTSAKYRNKIYVKNPKNKEALEEFRAATSARIGVGRAGDRPLTETILMFRADHALAIDSVTSIVDEKFVDELGLLKLHTRVKDKEEYITRPDLGRRLDDESINLVKEKCIKNPQIQVIICDGLSSKAIEANAKDILASFMQGLSVYNIKVGTPVFVKYGRVAAMDEIGRLVNAEAAIMFVGERPGLASAESMSAYMIYNPRIGADEAERTVLSNIFKGGTPPVEAGAHIATLMKKILDEKASGIKLNR